ncbi:long-chain fatty acid--CoA ligase [Epilithonimonas sp.]|uniref:long-chain fatty acid--CoA ligase n=1 Tax=Epilithonimonas sp. TaxID=2894511 RepID=UPI00289EB8CA|nr:long-chain fatty acid--CoA ligase [Epilithonimonas sp.]
MTIDVSKALPINLTSSNEFETKVLDFIKEWFSESKTVKIQSSGSTGIPKIFDIEKSKMLNSAEMTCDFLDLKEGNSALLCLPIEYISGKMMVVRSISRKLKLKIAPISLNPLENTNEEIDFCAMIPLQVENSLEKIHLIKNLIIGGASVSETLKSKISQTLKSSNSQTKIFETYGMSETLSHIALKQVSPNQEDWFTVFDGVEISLDERGCLKIVAPKLNSEVLQTNDLVEINDKKQFRFLGRIDNIINSGGAKIFPEELEKIVKKEIPNEVVFLGIENEKLGQKLVLIIEGENFEHLKSKIDNLKFEKSFHKPKEIIFVEQIPRTPNGKVNRHELKKLINN